MNLEAQSVEFLFKLLQQLLKLEYKIELGDENLIEAAPTIKGYGFMYNVLPAIKGSSVVTLWINKKGTEIRVLAGTVDGENVHKDAHLISKWKIQYKPMFVREN